MNFNYRYICCFLTLIVSVIGITAAYKPKGRSCKFPPAIQNGKLKLSNSNTEVEYTCNPRYKTVGETKAVCQNGRWSQPPPICITHGCNDLGYLQNGYLIYSYGRAMARFECQKQFNLKGPSVLACDGSKWNGTQPICKGESSSRKKSKEAFLQTRQRSKVNRKQRFHQKWLSRSDYSCIRKGASVAPPKITNAIPFTKWTIHGGIPRLYIQYVCTWGYVNKAKYTNLYCKKRRWAGKRPQCKQFVKKAYPQRDQSVPGSMTHTDWLRSADYTCMRDRTPPPVVQYGSWLHRNVILDASPRLYLEYKCDNGYELENADRQYMYCQRKTWAGQLPRCIRARRGEVQRADVNPCRVNNGGCDQICSRVQSGRRCSCHKNYELSKDGVSCMKTTSGGRDSYGRIPALLRFRSKPT